MKHAYNRFGVYSFSLSFLCPEQTVATHLCVAVPGTNRKAKPLSTPRGLSQVACCCLAGALFFSLVFEISGAAANNPFRRHTSFRQEPVHVLERAECATLGTHLVPYGLQSPRNCCSTFTYPAPGKRYFKDRYSVPDSGLSVTQQTAHFIGSFETTWLK